jgi:hypothetical protein
VLYFEIEKIVYFMKSYFLLISTLIVFSFSSCSLGTKKVKNVSNLDTVIETKTVIFDKEKISIACPKVWSEVKSKTGVRAFKMNCSDTISFCPVFSVTFANKIDSIPFVNYAKYTIQKLQERFTNIKFIHDTGEVVNSNEVFVIDYTVYIDSSKVHVGGTTAVYKTKDKIIVLNCMAGNNPLGSYWNYRKIFETVIESVKSI